MLRPRVSRFQSGLVLARCAFCFAFCLFGFEPEASADPLSLREAVQRAVERSPAVRARMEILTGVRARENGILGMRLPRIDFEETYLRTDQPVAVFGSLLNEGRFTSNLFNDPRLRALNHPDSLDNFRTRFSLTQPLFTGGTLHFQHQMSRGETEAEGHEVEAARALSGFQAVESYWGLSLALENLEVAGAAVEMAEENLRQIDALFREGTVVRSDLLLAKVQVADFQEQRVKAQGEVRVASRALNILVGNPQNGMWEVARLCVPAPEEMGPLHAEQLWERAKLQRPEYVALRARWAASEKGVKAARGSLLPHMGFQASYEWNAPKFSSDLEGSYMLGVGLEWNLFRGFGDLAALREAQSRRGRMGHELRRMEDGILLEIEEAVVAVETGRDALNVTRERVGLSEESLRIIAQRYREGLTTLLEMEQAELGLSRSRMAWLRAVYDLRIALARLQLLTGELLVSMEAETCPAPPGD